MKVTLLGTGTSQGIPIIGCKCEVCKSTNPKDKRLRTSAYIENNGLKILIDTSIDFRQQMLSNAIVDIDIVLFTHHHVDHILGMDDLRQINQRLDKYIDLYANEETINELKTTFRYALNEELQRYKSVPLVHFNIKKNENFNIKGTEIIPIEVYHGRIKIFGYRINNFAYITDCSGIDEEEIKKLYNLDVLVINALRKRPHPTHFNLEQATELSKRVKAKMTYFTHITHDLLHEETNESLPRNIELAYDGLTFDL